MSHVGVFRIHDSDRLRYCSMAIGAWAVCVALQWFALGSLEETGLALEYIRYWSGWEGISVRSTGPIYLAFLVLPSSRLQRKQGHSMNSIRRRMLFTFVTLIVWFVLVEAVLFAIVENNSSFRWTSTELSRKLVNLFVVSGASMVGAAATVTCAQLLLIRKLDSWEIARVVIFGGLTAGASVGAVHVVGIWYLTVWFSFLLVWQVGITFLARSLSFPYARVQPSASFRARQS